MKSSHKEEFTKKERLQQSSKLKEDNKGKIPVICNKDPNCKLKSLLKTKYLFSTEITIDKFLKLIRKKLEMEEDEALFIVANCKSNKYALVGSMSFGEIYDKYKDDDGFLYLIYSSEKIWG